MPTPKITHLLDQKPIYSIPNLFELAVTCSRTHTNITMLLLTEEVTTTHIPHIHKVLRTYLPTILVAKCFNENNLPFSEEVNHTEIGHLFEHIILEYLCKEKIHAGNTEAMFSGVTKWNWKKETYGTFHIQIDVSWQEKEILYFALKQSVLLLKRILLPQRQPEKILLNPFSFSSPDTSHMSPFLKSIITEKQMD